MKNTTNMMLTHPEQINVADIRPLILLLAKAMDVVLWRETNLVNGQTNFAAISIHQQD